MHRAQRSETPQLNIQGFKTLRKQTVSEGANSNILRKEKQIMINSYSDDRNQPVRDHDHYATVI